MSTLITLQIIYVQKMAEEQVTYDVTAPTYASLYQILVLLKSHHKPDEAQHTACSNTVLPLQIYFLFIIFFARYCRDRWRMNAQKTKSTLKMNYK